MNENAKIFVAGHRGLVGSALVRKLRTLGFEGILTRDRSQLDLENGAAVRHFFEHERPSHVFLAAAKVGGIWGNSTYPADYLVSNLGIQLNVISAAHSSGTAKLMFLGSSCIYPRLAEQPMREESLLTGPLESTNEAYAIAKIAGIKLCQAFSRQYGSNFVSVMPTNLYGPGDSFDLENGHVVPALLRKFHEAKVNANPSVTVWGTGTPRREFMHADDMASACAFLMSCYDSSEIINIGFGEDITISDLAQLVRDVVGYEGEIVFDATKPDGPPRKLLDVSRLRKMGWAPTISLREGLTDTYRWFTSNPQHLRSRVVV